MKPISWFKGDVERPGPLQWLRVAIPVAVLILILFWVMFVFLNEGFWVFRETASLPVARRQSGMDDRGMKLRIAIDRVGGISIADRALTSQELAEFLEKAKTGHGGICPVPVELRADANTPWDRVQPLLALLRRVEYTRISILTRDEDGEPSCVDARIDAPPTNTQIKIVCSDEKAMLNGRPCTVDELRKLLAKLGALDRYCPVSLASGPNSSVQNVVEVIGMSNENLDGEAVHLVDDTMIKTDADAQHNAPPLPRTPQTGHSEDAR